MNSSAIISQGENQYRQPKVLHSLPALTSTRILPKPEKFILALAHEIRNPLTNINLAVEMLQLATGEDDPKTYLDIIRRSSQRINEMIGNLMQHQLSEDVKMERHSINRLLGDVVEMAKDRIMLKNISVRKEYKVRDCKVLINRGKMKIALTNIIINAIDAVGTSKGELKIATKLIDHRFVLQIEDNGCGIDKKDLGLIFKTNYSNKPGGLGIGLATTYDILQLNRVKVHVESEKGKGTKFILLFEDHSW